MAVMCIIVCVAIKRYIIMTGQAMASLLLNINIVY